MKKKLPSLDSLLIRIRKERERLGFTQQEVANFLGKNQSTYNKLENGLHQLTYNEFLNLLEILEIDVESLVGNSLKEPAKKIKEDSAETHSDELKKALLKILNSLP